MRLSAVFIESSEVEKILSVLCCLALASWMNKSITLQISLMQTEMVAAQGLHES